MGKTRRGELETAASHQNSLSGRGLELLPELIRVPNERNVLRRLRVGVADDPRFTAMASPYLRELFCGESRELTDCGVEVKVAG